MEEKYEKMIQILETWMNHEGIPKSVQIQYYQKLIAVLEKKKADIKNLVLSSAFISTGIGLGIGTVLHDMDEFCMYMVIGFILSGIVVAIPNKKENNYLEDYEKIEEKRELIKKWWQEKKN